MPLETAEKFIRSVPALPEHVTTLRRDIVFYAGQVGATESACENVALAVGEALNNAAMHAYLGRDVGLVHVEAWSDASGSLFVRILDEGHGMTPRVDSPGLGLGLPLMAQMADQLHVATRDEGTGTIVALKFTLQPPAEAAP